MPEATRNQIADFEAAGITVREGIEYGRGGSQTLLMDCFYALESPRPMPAIIWLHGGGFTEENMTRLSRPEKSFVALAKRGYLIASIDYRLAQVDPFPAALQDSKCAVRFLRAHCKEFGIHPDKIGVWGESCGGQMAGLMSVEEGIEGFEGDGGWNDVSSRIAAAVSWYGGFDILSFTGMLKDKRAIVIYGGDPQSKLDLVARSSPMTYVSKKMSPILAMCSNTDHRVPDEQSINFCKRAVEHGNIAEFILVPGQGHGYFEGDEYYEQVYAFFDRYLKS